MSPRALDSNRQLSIDPNNSWRRFVKPSRRHLSCRNFNLLGNSAHRGGDGLRGLDRDGMKFGTSVCYVRCQLRSHWDQLVYSTRSRLNGRNCNIGRCNLLTHRNRFNVMKRARVKNNIPRMNLCIPKVTIDLIGSSCPI
jgi:hypothetical protein